MRSLRRRGGRARRGLLLPLAAATLAALAPLTGCYRGCPDDAHEFCLRHGKDCGQVSAENACGEVQSINCGSCYGPELCGGAGTPNLCATCTHPPVDKACKDNWCTIPAGCFTMGAQLGDTCHSHIKSNPPPYTVFGEEPIREVALDHSFQLMDTEVTQKQFDDLMGYNPSKNVRVPTGIKDTTHMPVEWVSWHEAAAYANALSASQGLDSCYACSGSGRFVSCQVAGAHAGAGIYDCPGYRLPTDAEWEYAFRAGSPWPLYNLQGLLDRCDGKPGPKLIEIAQCCSTDPGECYHHDVKSKLPNAWGLYDMAGGVFEWCHDWGLKKPSDDKATNPWGEPSGTHKVLRSCGFDWDEPAFFRASTRRLELPEHVCSSVGFRLARSLRKRHP